MATLRSILTTTNGLYREEQSGQKFQGPDLMQSLSEEDLDASVEIHKVSSGVYRIQLQSANDRVYELYSRRREKRTKTVSAAVDS